MQMYSESSPQQFSNEPPISSASSSPDWMALSEIYQRVMDVVIGYRNSAVSGGFDPHMADYMAAQLHTVMLQKLFSQ